MDKQKQIEEMIELMADWALRNNMCWHEGHAKALAETFAENDYEKVHEGAVVLTGEEYKKLIADSYNLKRLYEQYPYRVLVGFNSMVFSQDHEHYEKLFDDIEKRISEEIRKETAEKFAERAKELLDKQEKGWSANMIWIITAKNCIDEICKEITEG